MITAARLSTIVVGVTFAAAVALFALMLSSHEIDTAERHRVQSFIPMFVASAIFWSLFQQQFTVVALYAELDEKADHLRRADELKSRFLSNMSHEFRTPLNSILALSRLLLDRLDGPLTDEQV